MSDLRFHQFSCLKDNYGCLVHDPKTGQTALIDAPETQAVANALAETNWRLSHILVTHHHGDHTAGIQDIKSQTGAKVFGPRAEANRIPEIDHGIGEGDEIHFADLVVRVLETPGHTLGHVSYWIEDATTAFVGDTLFSLGCGRVFEGTNEMMWQSLKKINELPSETGIYCGHEYTAANAKFALSVEPGNNALQKRAAEVENLRNQGQPTVPTRLDIERETNPFLRPQSPEIRAHLMLPSVPDWQVFAELRERKNKA